MSNTFMEKIFCFLKWKHNDKINFFDSLLPSHRFIQCFSFFFNTCLYSGLSNLQLSWWIFSKSKHSKNHSILVINAGCVEGWDLFGSIKVATVPIIWFSFLSIFVAAQEQGFMFSLLLKFSIKQKQNQFVLDTWKSEICLARGCLHQSCTICNHLIVFPFEYLLICCV